MKRININGITYVDLEYAKEIYNLDGVDLTKGILRINATNRRYQNLHGKLFIAESKLKGKEIR